LLPGGDLLLGLLDDGDFLVDCSSSSSSLWLSSIGLFLKLYKQ
jgi:hypothetical protein